MLETPTARVAAGDSTPVSISRYFIRISAGFLYMTSTCLCAFEWPAFPEPPKSDSKWMLRDTQVNGLPMKVKVFHSKASTNSVLDYYRNRWRDEYEENRSGLWQQISKIDERYMYLVQVQADGKGSWGRQSVTDLRSIKTSRPGRGVPMMRNSTVISDFDDNDKGWRARTVGLINDFSINSNRKFYSDHFLKRGWQSYIDQATPDNDKVLAFRRGTEDISIIMHNKKGQTLILLNQVDRRMLN